MSSNKNRLLVTNPRLAPIEGGRATPLERRQPEPWWIMVRTGVPMRLTDLGSNVWADISYAVRGLKNTVAYAVALVLTLSLGLGAATTMLAIVSSVLLRPLVLRPPA